MLCVLKKIAVPLGCVLFGGILGGGVVTVLGQKEKTRLKEEAVRASDMAERAIVAAEKVAQKKNSGIA